MSRLSVMKPDRILRCWRCMVPRVGRNPGWGYFTSSLGGLAPDRYHVFPGAARTARGERMTLFLGGHGEEHLSCQLVIAGAGAQRHAQIGVVVEGEAGVELAGRGQADAVAGGAERLGDGADDP